MRRHILQNMADVLVSDFIEDLLAPAIPYDEPRSSRRWWLTSVRDRSSRSAMSPTEIGPGTQLRRILNRDGSPRRRNVSARIVISFCDSEDGNRAWPAAFTAVEEAVLFGFWTFVFGLRAVI